MQAEQLLSSGNPKLQQEQTRPSCMQLLLMKMIYLFLELNWLKYTLSILHANSYFWVNSPDSLVLIFLTILNLLKTMVFFLLLPVIKFTNSGTKSLFEFAIIRNSTVNEISQVFILLFKLSYKFLPNFCYVITGFGCYCTFRK